MVACGRGRWRSDCGAGPGRDERASLAASGVA